MKGNLALGAAAAAAAIIASLPLAARANIIDFESAPTGGCQVTAGGSIDGFTLSPYDGNRGAGFNNSSSCNFIAPTAHSGTQYIVNFNSVIGEFTKDVGTFTLDSLWVHSDARTGATTVRFQGLDGIGGSVLYSEDVGINAAWQQITFSGWTNVKSFTWDSLVPDVTNIAIDDFQYNAAGVPAPATAGLLALGLAVFGWARRRTS